MPILPSEVIAQTVKVLEEVCALLDDEIDERRRDPSELPAEAATLIDALHSVQALIPKLEVARAAMAVPSSLQPTLWLVDSEDSCQQGSR